MTARDKLKRSRENIWFKLALSGLLAELAAAIPVLVLGPIVEQVCGSGFDSQGCSILAGSAIGLLSVIVGILVVRYLLKIQQVLYPLAIALLWAVLVMQVSGLVVSVSNYTPPALTWLLQVLGPIASAMLAGWVWLYAAKSLKGKIVLSVVAVIVAYVVSLGASLFLIALS